MILHRIWQRKGVMPHEVYTLSRSQKAFIYASEEIEIEAELELERKQASK